MRFAVAILLSLSIVFTAGCTRSLDVNTKEVERFRLELPAPSSPNMEDYTIYVITEDNAEMVFERLKENGVDPVLFGLTDRGYEAKSVNDKRIVNYIIELRSILEEYKKYYESDR